MWPQGSLTPQLKAATLVQRDSLSKARTSDRRLRSLRRWNGQESPVSLPEQRARGIPGQGPPLQPQLRRTGCLHWLCRLPLNAICDVTSVITTEDRWLWLVSLETRGLQIFLQGSKISLPKWCRRKTRGQSWVHQGTLSQTLRDVWIIGKYPLLYQPSPSLTSTLFLPLPRQNISSVFITGEPSPSHPTPPPTGLMVLGWAEPRMDQNCPPLPARRFSGGLESPGRSQVVEGEV